MSFQQLESEIKAKLAEFVFPILAECIDLKLWLEAVTITDKHLTLQLNFSFLVQSFAEKIRNQLEEFLHCYWPELQISISVTTTIKSHKVQSGLKSHLGIKNIIAVGSGKGGVGKSTIANNLAVALAKEGAKVGLLDADIYGPNQPQMLGLNNQAIASEDNKLEPMANHGVKAMSIGFLIQGQDTPMIWRGPMVSMALQQMLNDTRWGELDYLVIDLPPGTGDIQLTLAQKIPVSGALIITTPQDIALADVRKAIKMFQKVSVPILGIVENMSLYVCPHCGSHDAIFGEGGAEKINAEYHVPCLGRIPLNRKIRELMDEGHPVVLEKDQTELAEAFSHIAIKLSYYLALQTENPRTRFPDIVIEKE